MCELCASESRWAWHGPADWPTESRVAGARPEVLGEKQRMCVYVKLTKYLVQFRQEFLTEDSGIDKDDGVVNND